MNLAQKLVADVCTLAHQARSDLSGLARSYKRKPHLIVAAMAAATIVVITIVVEIVYRIAENG